MIWHPGALALLVGSGAVLFMAATAVPFAIRILRRWDAGSCSEQQFALEKGTYLISTLVTWALAVNAGAIFLLIATADSFSRFLTGAMCATGAFNASPAGWWALGVKCVLLLGGWIWIEVNALDNRSPSSPLIRFKYAFLLFLLPLFALDFGLLWKYFAGIDPDVITSCCGSLFSSAVEAPRNALAAISPRVMLPLHHAAAAAIWVLGLPALRTGKAAWCAGYSIAAALSFPVAIASSVSFIAPSVYGMLTHHCPFELFQGAYRYLGYPLFLSLFATTAWGVLPGLFLPAARHPGLAEVLPGRMRRWIGLSLLSRLIFDGIVYYHLYGAGMIFS